MAGQVHGLIMVESDALPAHSSSNPAIYSQPSTEPDLLRDKPAIAASNLTKSGKVKFRFTRENAREMLARSREARMRNLAANLPQAEPRQAPAIVNRQPNEQKPKPDTFTSQRLSRVRKQLLKLDSMLAQSCDSEEIDAGHIDKLASAISRLSEIERQLADRPLPGSKRPTQEKPQNRSSWLLGVPEESSATGPTQSEKQDQE